jgi:signal transduction protein with GAF and PtsI domain
MRRFEEYARRTLSGLEQADVATLVRTLREEELVRLLGGMPDASDADRLRKNVVTTELENRIVRLRTLIDETVTPGPERDLSRFTRAIARALRVDGACIDEVVSDDEFRLHGQFGLPEEVMRTERCASSALAMCDHVLATGRTLNVPDIPADPRWMEAPAYRRHGLHHYTGAPGHTSDGKLRCVVWVAHHHPRTFHEQEILLLERLAQRLATEFATPDTRRALLVHEARASG